MTGEVVAFTVEPVAVGAAVEGPGVVPGRELVVKGMGGDGEALVLAPGLEVALVVLMRVLVCPGRVSWDLVVGSLPLEVLLEAVEGPTRVVALVVGITGVRVPPEDGEGPAVVPGVDGQWR